MPAQGQKFKLRLMKERWDFLNLYFIGSVKDFFLFQSGAFVCFFVFKSVSILALPLTCKCRGMIFVHFAFTLTESRMKR